MKPIKIIPANAKAITAALKAVNKSAVTHTYAEAWEIVRLVDAADAELARIQLPKTMHVGAKYHATSGEAVSNSYAKKAHTRIATSVTLERRSTGWFLVGVEAATIWKQGGTERLVLTEAQRDEAIARFRGTLHWA